MTSNDLADVGAVALGRLFRSGEVSPVEATRAVLRRIEECEPRLNAFVIVDEEGALGAAAASERRHRLGEAKGPLDGVTATVKDLLAMAGFPTRRGSRVTPDTPAAEDSPVVARLREAGCVLLGKTTTTEHGWSGLSFSPLTGITHNPWRHGLIAGGSSAGAAAAAASGMGVLHLGTDGGGSVRGPAHHCGVVGFKATYGAVPNVPLANNNELSHTGPITRRVEDAALMLRRMAGPHAGDPGSLPAGFLDDAASGAGGRKLSIAYSPDLGHLQVDPEVRDVVADAMHRIEDALGAHVEEVVPPWAADGAAIMEGLWATAFRRHLDQPAEVLDLLDPAFLARMRTVCLGDNAPVSWADYFALRGRRIAYAAAVNTWLSRYDLLATPVMSVAAFDASGTRPPHWPGPTGWSGFAYHFNLSHSPAMSIPAGLTPQGLPVGLQLAAPRLRDAFLLDASARIEAVLAPEWIGPPATAAG